MGLYRLGSMFPSAPCLSAAPSRLTRLCRELKTTNHAHTIICRSWRMRRKEQQSNLLSSFLIFTTFLQTLHNPSWNEHVVQAHCETLFSWLHSLHLSISTGRMEKALAARALKESNDRKSSTLLWVGQGIDAQVFLQKLTQIIIFVSG